MRHTLVTTFALATCFACSTTPAAPSATDSNPASGSSSAASKNAVTCDGVFVPGEFDTLSLWPEAYRGELLLLRVLPPGTMVDEGTVVAELDTESLDEELADARRALASKRIAHAGLLERNAIAAESAASKLVRAEAALFRARRGLAGLEKEEREFQTRQDELARRREQSWVDDQKDELAQLQAMYEADELTDETEEIVLKRSERALALTLDSNALSEDRRQYADETTRAFALEARREDVAKKGEDLAHQKRMQTLEAATRADAEARSLAELDKKERHVAELERDRELLTLRAPRAGRLLHGGIAAHRSGAALPKHERGGTLRPRADAFLIADPDALAVALDVSETERDALADGSSVTVKPVACDDCELSGTLSLSMLPTNSQGEASRFEGTVKITGAAGEHLPGTRAVVEAAPGQDA